MINKPVFAGADQLIVVFVLTHANCACAVSPVQSGASRACRALIEVSGMTESAQETNLGVANSTAMRFACGTAAHRRRNMLQPGLPAPRVGGILS
ncbi:MAG: hypothetical protein KGJ62_15005, partial [Armatimonadetes bacterium]|nr:hypothetical protein [Armatimonadota bacterium]